MGLFSCLVLLPYALPSLAVLAFLVLTEKDRNKPWIKAQIEAVGKEAEERFSDPLYAKQYGLLSGALWIFVIAIFLILSFSIGFQFSWIIFIIAEGFQVLMELFINWKVKTK